MNDDSLRAEARQLDEADVLKSFRDEFYLPSDATGAPVTYLCGHSLGLQPRNVRQFVEDELLAWQREGVEAHFSGERPWVSYHERLAPPLASLAGAHTHEVVAMNSLSVNLHLLLVTFYRPTRERHKILIEQSAFPSDRYAVAAHLRLHGFDPAEALIEIAPRHGETLLRHEDICETLEREGAQIATVLLPGVSYLSGQRFDIEGLTAAARGKGCTIGFDLAHAIGNVPLSLHDAGLDFAVWCSYKYLNGGPGAIGGAFVHERHARAFDLPRLAGWWGHDKVSRFAMPHKFSPLSGAEGWQVSNPPILAMAPLLASFDLFDRASLAKLRIKSEHLTAFAARALHLRLSERVDLLTPLDIDARGAQLSLILKLSDSRAHAARESLRKANIICDWREPNVIRAAFAPLYNTYNDAWRLCSVLEEILV